MDEIESIEMPRKFFFPNMRMYNDTCDPDNHVAQYKTKVAHCKIPKRAERGAYVQRFQFNPNGPALQWYINLHNGSIRSFAILTDKFMEQFVSSISLEKMGDDLYEILQP